MITILPLPLFDRVLGADHPDRARARNKRAVGYLNAGQAAKAVPLYKRTLADCERVLGPRHPDTNVVRENLAALSQ